MNTTFRRAGDVLSYSPGFSHTLYVMLEDHDGIRTSSFLVLGGDPLLGAGVGESSSKIYVLTDYSELISSIGG